MEEVSCKKTKKIERILSNFYPLEDLVCKICEDLIIDPKQCKSCEEICCTSCIDKIKKCPNSTCQATDFSEVTKKWLKHLYNTTILCENNEDGCQKNLIYLEIEQHQKNECDFREIICENCQQLFKRPKMSDHKEKYCPSRNVNCPNDGCKSIVKLKDMDNHFLECEFIPQCTHKKCLQCEITLKKQIIEKDKLTQRIETLEEKEIINKIERKNMEVLIKNLEVENNKMEETIVSLKRDLEKIIGKKKTLKINSNQ